MVFGGRPLRPVEAGSVRQADWPVYDRGAQAYYRGETRRLARTRGADMLLVVKLPSWPNTREPTAAGGDSMNDPSALESELAPESEVVIEVSRRLPLLLVVAVVLMAIVCWRRMHRHEHAAARDDLRPG
jgi:hypothetical protein